jgi:hypothetical protein
MEKHELKGSQIMRYDLMEKAILEGRKLAPGTMWWNELAPLKRDERLEVIKITESQRHG